MALISVIYHHFPHYRAPVLRALARSTRHKYRFFGARSDYDGIKAFTGDENVTIEEIEFLRDSGRKIDIAGFEPAVSPPFDATIVIGNINMKGSWQAVSQARRNGLATAYWAHGWLRREAWYKAKLRNFYFSRADRVLTYGSRAVEIARASGFPEDRMRVIWNSLDWDEQSRHFRENASVDQAALRHGIGMPAGVPVIMTISRVTQLCRYDWLIDAVAHLRRERDIPAEIWMVGDGPELAALTAQAKAAGVPLHLKGALYDEADVARHVMAADVIASPGKIGLTAMHALAYGTPAVTHSDFDRQMPEVEALVDGVSGAFFDYGDTMGLARALERVLADQRGLDERRLACRACLEGRFTPDDQARLIDDAMTEIVNVRAKR